MQAFACISVRNFAICCYTIVYYNTIVYYTHCGMQNDIHAEENISNGNQYTMKLSRYGGYCILPEFPLHAGVLWHLWDVVAYIIIITDNFLIVLTILHSTRKCGAAPSFILCKLIHV